MSIRKMISLHPSVHGHVNQPLGDAVHHLMYCSKMCRSSADACSAEAVDMVQCVRLCMDCADICDATCNVALRQTGDDQQTVRELLELCARACDNCAAECERHDHEHCRLCAQMCRECAEDCRNAAKAVTEPA
ncbi:MAG TPA: four-helix bundle copper-binding protein [Sphingomicrobium sp.]|nr:four-helix bundle copper-binding protein [Sphingomicrobium sp.]